ncbi:extensin-like [Xenopus tropicalis]|uniref:Extensin-like n=1 Tax=Xenopus tropicalis TaxID=8364 RepID=A0A8J1JXM1_XENTR|nr:extensin-like [Xenopus tropicalis]
MSMEQSRASGCYPILNQPPPPYHTLYIDPPIREPPEPSSRTYWEPSLPPYQPSPQSSATTDRSSQRSPPGYCELPPPYCVTNGSSLHAPPLDSTSSAAQRSSPDNHELPPPYCVTNGSSLHSPPLDSASSAAQWSPPDNHELPPPYCITNGSSPHVPPPDSGSPEAVSHQRLEDPPLRNDRTSELCDNNCCLCFSFCNFILFPPLGLVSIIFSLKVRGLIYKQEREKLKKLSLTLLKTNLIIFIMGLVLGPLGYTLVAIYAH